MRIIYTTLILLISRFVSLHEVQNEHSWFNNDWSLQLGDFEVLSISLDSLLVIKDDELSKDWDNKLSIIFSQEWTDILFWLQHDILSNSFVFDNKIYPLDFPESSSLVKNYN